MACSDNEQREGRALRTIDLCCRPRHAKGVNCFKSIALVTVLGFAVPVQGCSNLARGTAIGAGAGAGVGAGIGAAISKDGKGAAIGAIIGAVVGGSVGAVIGNEMDKRARQIEQDLEGATVTRVGEGILVTFRSGILFDVNKADLKSAAKENIEQLTKVLERYDDTDIVIAGHTDSSGSSEHNHALSQRRAESVAAYARSHGVAESRIRIVGEGEDNPVADNETSNGRQKNRRVEVAIFANDKLRKRAEKKAG